MRRSWLAIVAVLIGSLGVGCARDPMPQLLTVRDLAPREVELGDRLEVSGAGFAQGRPAHVHLHGVAERPGEDPEPIEVDLTGDVITPERIQITVDDAVIGKLCGTGVHQSHTTFDGTAEILFAATTEGAPPVTGVLSHVTLDAFPPSTPRAQLEARAGEGTRFLDGAGLHVRGEADSFVVDRVDAESAAARSGLLAGDVIVAASGVRVASLGDFAPPPSALSVPVAVRRGASEHEEVHAIALAASAAPLSSRLLVPALLVALALLVVLFGAAAPGRVVPWLRRRLHDGPRGSIVRELVPPARTVVRYALPTVAFAGTLAAPLFPTADVSAFVLAIVFARVVAAIVTPSESKLRHRVLAALTSGFPLLVVTGGAIVTTGSRSLEELVASSASAPLGCAAFRSPIHLALAATALFLGVAPAVASATRAFEDPNWVRRGRFASAWEWLGAWVQAALVAVLFFGGWRAGGAAIAVAGAAFALKTALLFVIAVALRSALSPALPAAAVKSALLRGAPAALLLVVLARVWEEHVAARVVQMGATVASIAIVLALAVALGRRPGAVRRVGLDPFR